VNYEGIFHASACLMYRAALYSPVRNILSRVLVTKDGFGLVIRFINHLEIVTKNYYYTFADLRYIQSLHTNLLSLFRLVFTIRFLATDL
jgi:hypothetical protein